MTDSCARNASLGDEALTTLQPVEQREANLRVMTVKAGKAAHFGPIFGMASSAERMRRLRARAGAGLAVLPVETNLVALVDHLIATGRLGEWDAENRDAICEAAGRLLDEIVAFGVQEPEI